MVTNIAHAKVGTHVIAHFTLQNSYGTKNTLLNVPRPIALDANNSFCTTYDHSSPTPMSFKIDFSEPMPQMIERLKKEHSKLLPELSVVEKACRSDVSQALVLLHGLKDTIMRHAVEEEARVMRVIMEKAKSDSSDSVRIMQEHRWVAEFFERRLDKLPEETEEKARDEILKFIQDLREHFREEEQIVFPLALKALNKV